MRESRTVLHALSVVYPTQTANYAVAAAGPTSPFRTLAGVIGGSVGCEPVSRFVVAEVVTNSYDHAFPGGKGSITVSVQCVPDVNTMTMPPSDDGEGFKAQAESKRHGLGLVRRLVEPG
jgi:hypothetical protein